MSSTKAVIYARFSSHGQNEQSIDGQLRICNDYAANKNIMIVGHYIDMAKTGTNDNRPEFQRMIEDSKKKQFDYVLVWKFDRFARERLESAINKHKLKKNDVKVLSVTEPTGGSVVVEAIYEAVAQKYSEDLSENVRRGQKESVLKGTTLGGTAPLGYKRVDKKNVIDEDEARIVRFVYEEYANGTTKKQIINKLNLKGLKVF